MKIKLNKKELLGLIEAINAAANLGESLDTFLYQGDDRGDTWENVFKVQAYREHVLISKQETSNENIYRD